MTILQLQRRASKLKSEWPGYGELFDFYLAVRDAQDRSKERDTSARTSPTNQTGHLAGIPDEGLTVPNGFPIEPTTARTLFLELCKVGKEANAYFSIRVQEIEDSISSGRLDLDALISGGINNSEIEHCASELNLDETVLGFLIFNSTQPAIEILREELLLGYQLDTWKKPACPVCKSVPTLSLFKGETGKRHSLCSHCGCEWPVDRTRCSICGDDDKNSVHYFHSEGQKNVRVYTCDTCKHYIKSVDVSANSDADPILEDLATLHLDVVAVEKGYVRSVPNQWCE